MAQGAVQAHVDKRNSTNRKLVECTPWTLYGGRGASAQLHGLSAYEFAMHFHIKQARHPYTFKTQHASPDKYEAALTEEGLQKLEKNIKKLVPGTDYAIRETGGADWWPLGDGLQVKPYRHDWIIKLRRRLHVPVIFGAQSSRTTEEQAMRILILYFPWVNDVKDETPAVPFINRFWQPDTEDWTQALLLHASRVQFQTEEVKRLVLNFVFTYCLPRQARLTDGLEENSDNEDLADDLADFELDENDWLEATLTHVRGSGVMEDALDPADEEGGRDEGENLQEQGPAANPATRLYDLTMDMFRLSNAIWQRQEGAVEEAARRRHEEILERTATWSPDHSLALQAARDSDNSAKKENANIGLLGEGIAVAEAGWAQTEPFPFWIYIAFHPSMPTTKHVNGTVA